MMKIPRKPILVDESMNIAFAVKYAIYALFGFAGIFFAVPSIAEVAGGPAARVISALVFLLSTVACVSTYRSLNSSRWERVEFYSTIGLISFVAVYDAAAIWLTILGSTGRLNLAIIASALLVFPGWRVYYIYKKNRNN